MHEYATLLVYGARYISVQVADRSAISYAIARLLKNRRIPSAAGEVRAARDGEREMEPSQGRAKEVPVNFAQTANRHN